MAKLLPFEAGRPLSHSAAARRIKDLWCSGNFTFTRHAEERLRERNFEISDVEHLIEKGRVTEHSHPGQAWRYTLTGKTVDGHPIAAVFELAGSSLTMVTVLFKRR
jgi:hypothetical protein